jgi:hypothetical protein
MKTFPNGFTSWIETHHEVVSYITRQLDNNYLSMDTKVAKEYESGGTGRVYELAADWTDLFESENNGRDWDGEFFDELEEFLNKQNAL